MEKNRNYRNFKSQYLIRLNNVSASNKNLSASSFPILENGYVLRVNLKGFGDIGDATIIKLENKEYTLKLDLDQPVDDDLFPTITWSSTNGIANGIPFITLSRDFGYSKFVLSIGEQRHNNF